MRVSQVDILYYDQLDKKYRIRLLAIWEIFVFLWEVISRNRTTLFAKEMHSSVKLEC